MMPPSYSIDVLLTHNIKEFIGGLVRVTGHLYVVNNAYRYAAGAGSNITIVDEPQHGRFRFYSAFFREHHVGLVFAQGFHDLLFFGILGIIRRFKYKLLVVSHSPYTWETWVRSFRSLLMAICLGDGLVFSSLRESCRWSP